MKTLRETLRLDSCANNVKQEKYARSSLLASAVIVVTVALPMTDVFWVFDRIPAAVYVAFIWTVFVLITRATVQPWALKLNEPTYLGFLLLLAMAVLVSYALGSSSPQATRYALWFLWIIMGYGAGSVLLMQATVSTETIVRSLRWGVGIACILGLQDWLVGNDIAPGPSLLSNMVRGETDYDARLLGLLRMRGPVEEAAHFGMFLNGLVPLTFTIPFHSRLKAIVYGITVATTYVLTLSLAAWAALGMSAIIVAIVFWRHSRIMRTVAWVTIAMGGIIVLLSFVDDNQLLARIGDENDPSYLHRMEMYKYAVMNILEANGLQLVFGHGAASFIGQYQNNPISAYLFLFHDFGLVALMIFLVAMVVVFKKILSGKAQPNVRGLLAISLLSMLIHYGVTANIWHPWLWFASAFAMRLANHGESHNRYISTRPQLD